MKMMDTVIESAATIRLCNEAHAVHLTQAIVQTNDLAIGYGKRLVSGRLNLNIRNGEMVCLLGKNGCGKSTLMRSIAGLQPPLAGEVTIGDKLLGALKVGERARLLSLVLTDRIDAGNSSVSEIVAIGRHPHTNSFGSLSQTDKAVIARSLTQCGLDGFADRMFAQLSDGEKQRVMIARALAQDTPLIMLDEPTAHLDLPSRIAMMRQLRQMAKDLNKAILITTHELDLALQWADTLWLMDNGGAIHSGCPEDLVLDGTFTRVFGNESFHFDMSTGSFKMKRPLIGSVNLYGNGVRLEWTRRALEREGFAIDKKQNSASSIEILPNNTWLYSCNNVQRTANTVGELLGYLRHEAYYLTLHNAKACNVDTERMASPVIKELCTI